MPPVLAWEALSCVLSAAFTALVIDFELVGVVLATGATFTAQAVLSRALVAEEHARENAALRRDLDRTRRDLASDLHDDAVQQLMAARQDVIEALAGDTSRLERASTGLERTLDALRDLLHHLHEPPGESIDARLAALAEEAHAQGFDCSVRVGDGMADRPDGVVFRSVRELVLNVVKHSKGTRVDVVVAADNGWVRAVVRDDEFGVPTGWSIDAVPSDHYGLRLLSQRLSDVGGTVAFGAVDPHGLDVRLRVPAG